MNNNTNNDMSEYWNGEGGEKWVGQHETTNTFLLPLGQKAIDIAEIKDGELILDIGCGCGETSFDMAKLVGEAGHVNGLDISRQIINRAREIKKQTGVKNVTFQCGDAQVFELEEVLYDLIYSRFGVMFFDDPVSAFSNIRSSLDNNGRLVFTSWMSKEDNQWISIVQDVISKYTDLPISPDINAPGPFSLSDPQRIKDILSAVGFSEIHIMPNKPNVNFGNNIADAVNLLTQTGPASSAISSSELSDDIVSNILTDIKEAIKPYETNSGVMLGAATWVVTASNKK